MRRTPFSLLLLILTIPAATAQKEPDAATGTISGVVREAGTGHPISGAMVNCSGAERRSVQTDTQGRYSIPGLPPDLYRISVTVISANGPGAYGMRRVRLREGQNLPSVDYLLEPRGEISGRVIDENDEPVPEVRVFLVARDYSEGSLRYRFTGTAEVDDRGEYVLRNVAPGRAYLVMAAKWILKLPAISDVPANPKLRKPVPAPTFYPGVTLRDGAQPLILDPGQRRQNVDIRMQRGPSFCVSGLLSSGSRPSGMHFTLTHLQATSGAVGNGAFFMASPSGETNADGKIRLCHLPPGEYRLEAWASGAGGPSAWSVTTLAVVDDDIRDLRVGVRAPTPVAVETVWEGKAPEPPIDTKLSFHLMPLVRSRIGGETLGGEVSIPGESGLPNLFMDDYALRLARLPARSYVKDILLGGRSIRHEPVSPGASLGENRLRIVLAGDGGTIEVKVADKEGNLIPDASVVAMPAGAVSEAVLAASIVTGQTDQEGNWSTGMVAPGKYYLLVTTDRVDNSPEFIGRLWRSRTLAQEVELEPRASRQVTLELSNSRSR